MTYRTGSEIDWDAAARSDVRFAFMKATEINRLLWLAVATCCIDKISLQKGSGS